MCRYCGDLGTEIEHVNPACEGGDDNPLSNLVWSCSACNQAKGSKQGFSLDANVLTWHGTNVEKDGLYGDSLWSRTKENMQSDL